MKTSSTLVLATWFSVLWTSTLSAQTADSEKALMAVAFSPVPAEILFNLHKATEHRKQQAAAFEKLTTNYPDSKNTVMSMLMHGQTLSDLQLHEEAGRKYAEIAERFPDDPNAVMGRFFSVQALEYEGKTREAVIGFRSFIEDHPGHASAGSAARHVTYMMADHGRYDEALDYGKTAMPTVSGSSSVDGLERLLAALPSLGKDFEKVKWQTADAKEMAIPSKAVMTLLVPWNPTSDKSIRKMEDYSMVEQTVGKENFDVVGIVNDEAVPIANDLIGKIGLDWTQVPASHAIPRLSEEIRGYPSFLIDASGKLIAVGPSAERLILLVRKSLRDSKESE